jgi:hypothetical protein
LSTFFAPQQGAAFPGQIVLPSITSVCYKIIKPLTIGAVSNLYNDGTMEFFYAN